MSRSTKRCLNLVLCSLSAILWLALPGHAATQPLDIALPGTGSGSVNYVSGSLSGNCSADCTLQFDEGTTVILSPVAGVNTTFDGWDCSGGTLMGSNCGLVMYAPKSVTATFSSTWPARVSPGDTTYATFQAAYDHAGDGSTVNTADTTFVEELVCNRDIPLTFSGGWDAGFTTRAGFTTIDGSLTIAAGSITIESLIIT